MTQNETKQGKARYKCTNVFLNFKQFFYKKINNKPNLKGKKYITQ